MMRKVEASLFGVLLLGLAVFVSYQFIGGNKAMPSDNKSYSTDMKELRKKFNDNKGKVRVLLLLSPT